MVSGGSIAGDRRLAYPDADESLASFPRPLPTSALLMDREPNNQQAQSLNQLIEKSVAREGYIGMALMGGAAAVGSILLAGLVRRGRR